MNKLIEEILKARIGGVLSQLADEVETEHYDFHSDSIDKAQEHILEAIREALE